MTSTPLIATPIERTLPDQIEHRLACEILRGERPPGSRLPTVRALAEHYDVTVPTIQRALDRLGRTGLVTAKGGSGVTVNDPKRNMNLSLIPVWFEALAAEPEAAAKILRDFLALRRILTRHLFAVSPQILVASLPELASARLEVPARPAGVLMDRLFEGSTTVLFGHFQCSFFGFGNSRTRGFFRNFFQKFPKFGNFRRPEVAF